MDLKTSKNRFYPKAHCYELMYPSGYGIPGTSRSYFAVLNGKISAVSLTTYGHDIIGMQGRNRTKWEINHAITNAKNLDSSLVIYPCGDLRMGDPIWKCDNDKIVKMKSENLIKAIRRTMVNHAKSLPDVFEKRRSVLKELTDDNTRSLLARHRFDELSAKQIAELYGFKEEEVAYVISKEGKRDRQIRRILDFMNARFESNGFKISKKNVKEINETIRTIAKQARYVPSNNLA